MTASEDLRPFLEPGIYVDSDHPDVIAFARREAGGTSTPRDIAVKLFYAVRDQVRYDPYHIDLSIGGLKASRCLATGHGFCITKAALLAAVLRVHGIATRLAFADVRNHMTSPRLQATMGTDIFSYHGNVDIWLDDHWVKATPAFNLSLCQKFGLLPLDFDGRGDSIYHPFDVAGNRHMEYVHQRGSFDDLPLDQIMVDFRVHYPRWIADMALAQPVESQADFLAEVQAEIERGAAGADTHPAAVR
jgi:transglutaminase-like putative cysteine protease